jgi:hypothetical protein
MKKNWMAWYKKLPSDLLQAAYRSSSGDLAWPKEQALQALKILGDNGYEIYGVDPWLATQPGPTPIIYDWPLRTMPNLTASQFIEQFDALYPGNTLETNSNVVFNIGVKAK